MKERTRRRKPAQMQTTKDRIRVFVASYLLTLNATKAAIDAGYSKKTAGMQGSRLMKRVDVQALLAARAEKALTKSELTAERVLEELRRIAFCDIRGFYDTDGRVLQVHELGAEQAAALHSVELVMKNARAGDGIVDEVLKFRVHDKLKALELLAKYFKLISDNVNVNLNGHLTVDVVKGMTDDDIKARLRQVLGDVPATTMIGANA